MIITVCNMSYEIILSEPILKQYPVCQSIYVKIDGNMLEYMYMQCGRVGKILSLRWIVFMLALAGLVCLSSCVSTNSSPGSEEVPVPHPPHGWREKGTPANTCEPRRPRASTRSRSRGALSGLTSRRSQLSLPRPRQLRYG